MADLPELIISRMNYVTYVALMMLGLYAIFAKKNLMKKIIGMNILQTAIILFFISVGAKRNATIPILEHGAHHGNSGAHAAVDATHYINPLPHVLMLTAIVVAVATLGVALAMTIKIYKDYGTIEEDRLLAELKEDPEGGP